MEDAGSCAIEVRNVTRIRRFKFASQWEQAKYKSLLLTYEPYRCAVLLLCIRAFIGRKALLHNQQYRDFDIMMCDMPCIGRSAVARLSHLGAHPGAPRPHCHIAGTMRRFANHFESSSYCSMDPRRGSVASGLKSSQQQVAPPPQQPNAAGGDGSVWGSALLVAGTTVGAGILALPTTAQDSGFLASSVALSGCALYSIITGLLLAEVNINAQRVTEGPSNVSLVTMSGQTLGSSGTAAAAAAYVFLHYALLVACKYTVAALYARFNACIKTF